MIGKEINSKEMVEKIKTTLKRTVDTKIHKPSLVIIQIEGDKASDSYVKNKVKVGEEVGITVKHIKMKQDTSEKELLNMVDVCNRSNCDGIIVQLPLPKDIDERKVLDTIEPTKDVDGLGTHQIGLLNNGSKEALIPCTALGVMEMLIRTLTTTQGKDVVIVNRSHLIGKPLQVLLTENNATVTLCHSKTKNLKEKMLNADIVITGIGKANYFDKSYFKDGQIIIDCSMNLDENNKLCGDVKKQEVLDNLDVKIASGKGHTGLFTVVSLITNTIISADRRERNVNKNSN